MVNPITELEALAYTLEAKITNEWYTRTVNIYPDLLTALTTAYTLGKSSATSEARRAASRNNGAAPVKPGSRKRGRPNKNETGQKEVKP